MHNERIYAMAAENPHKFFVAWFLISPSWWWRIVIWHTAVHCGLKSTFFEIQFEKKITSYIGILTWKVEPWIFFTIYELYLFSNSSPLCSLCIIYYLQVKSFLLVENFGPHPYRKWGKFHNWWLIGFW